MQVDNLERVKLAQLPTPLHKLEGLTNFLEGPNIYVKRDDLTGLGLGGNKVRKLEFILADAKKNNADVVLTTGGEQSNHCMLTALAAQKNCMEATLFLRGKQPKEFKGNLILGNTVSEIIFIDEDKQQVGLAMQEKAREYEKKGRKPYLIPVGGSIPLGAMGYFISFNEIMEQAKKMNILPTHIVFAWGSGGTHAGLTAGAKVSEYSVETLGINVDHKETAAGIKQSTAKLASDTLSLISSEKTINADEINIFTEYVGEEGYGKPSNSGMKAIELIAKKEGFFLDPVYTGKAMAGLIDLVIKGFFKKDDHVVFLHTGGAGSIFAFPDNYLSISSS